MSPKRVLLVDDNEFDRMHIRRLLNEVDETFDICEVTTVRAALDKLGERTFDVGILDYRLPDGDALDILPAISAPTGSTLPAIVLTAMGDEKAAKRALALGAQDYLLKDELSAALLLRSLRYAQERRRAHALQRQAMHADRLKALGRLSAGVAHEVNNPATYIRANLELMLEDVDRLRQNLSDTEADQPCAELLDDLSELARDNLEGIDRIANIVSEMGVFSRMRTGNAEPISPNDVVERALRLMSNELRHRVEVELELGQVPDLVAFGQQLTQVVTNLLLNAVHAAVNADNDHPKVTVRTRQGEAKIFIEVEDNGEGIPDALAEHIFDPFFTTKEPGEGTGLGLSVCAQIVEAHEGTIEALSRRPQGTLMRVSLPVDSSLKKAHEISEAFEEPDRPRRARILLVEDDDLVRRSLRRLLGRDHEVIDRDSGPAALDFLAETDQPVDAILCDLMLPNMDGRQIFTAISQTHPELARRVVFMTGGAFTEELHDFLESAANPVVPKPIDSEFLSNTLAEVISEAEQS